MAGITAIVDTLPDTDSFLPRYLTVQLLQILAKTIQPIASKENPAISQQAKDFIAGIKKPDLFNPLTYSIFWRDMPEQALDKYTDPLDKLDQYSHSPLTMALTIEDFVLAAKLIDKGANVFLEDKLVLEIALISMMQRNPNTLEQILAGTAPDDRLWIKEYLDYLHGYVIGKPKGRITKKRDIINPPVRHFGQVLDTLVYFNGTPSYYGFLSPSLSILTAHLRIYTKEITDQALLTLFKPIADAFEFFRTTSKLHGNLPTATNAAEELTKQINYNLASKNNNLTILAGGWAGNAIAIAFINKYLVLSNLGTGGGPQHGTKIFALKNSGTIAAADIDSFIRGLGNASAPQDILAILGDLVESKALFTINQPLNPIDNCIFVNPRAIVQGILLVLDCCQKNGSASTEQLTSLAPRAADLYKGYLNSLYMHSTEDLARFMRNHELLQNKRVECCSLALEYINQHYKDPDALKRCIDLKNALEFVGLKDYYIQNIHPDAKAAIQKVVIREQELTALQVIELEYAMLAKQQ